MHSKSNRAQGVTLPLPTYPFFPLLPCRQGKIDTFEQTKVTIYPPHGKFRLDKVVFEICLLELVLSPSNNIKAKTKRGVQPSPNSSLTDPASAAERGQDKSQRSPDP